MAQIFNFPTPLAAPHWATNLGEGLVSGLESLANARLRQVQAKKMEPIFKQYGLPTELAYAPQEIQQTALAQTLRNLGRPNSQQGGLTKEMLINGLKWSPEKAELYLAGNPNERKIFLQNELSSSQNADFERLAREAAGLPVNQNNVTPSAERPPFQTPLSPERQRDIINIGQNKRKEEAAENRFNKKFKLQQDQIIRNISTPYRQAAEASKKNITDYKQLIKLADSGKLRAGNTQQLLSKLGFEGFNRNFETQLADKVMARLGQNAQSAFGTGRLTNYLEQTFQRSLPTLWNTPEGIKSIAKINMLSDEANILKNDTRIELLKKYNGDLPTDFEDQIDAILRPKIQELEEKALEIASNPYQTKVGSTFEKPPKGNYAINTEITNKSTGQKLYYHGNNKWGKARI